MKKDTNQKQKPKPKLDPQPEQNICNAMPDSRPDNIAACGHSPVMNYQPEVPELVKLAHKVVSSRHQLERMIEDVEELERHLTRGRKQLAAQRLEHQRLQFQMQQNSGQVGSVY